MTAELQSEEYIINEDDIQNGMKLVHDRRWLDIVGWFGNLRSRSHLTTTPSKISRITHTRFERDGLHYRIDNGIEDIISLRDRDAAVRNQMLNELKPIIRELRNALIVSANNAHTRKKLVNECNPSRMFYNEMQYQSLVESALACSSDFKGEYESDTALDWYRESLIKQEHAK